MADRMVEVINTDNAIIGIAKPQYGANYKWVRYGQKIRIPFEKLEQMLYEPGVESLIRSGSLYIPNMQDKIDLGLEPADATEPQNIIVLTPEQMKTLWTVKPLEVFKSEISKLSQSQLDNVIDYAIANKITVSDKCQYIRDLTKRDIFKAVSRELENEEIDAKQAALEERRKNEDGRR